MFKGILEFLGVLDEDDGGVSGFNDTDSRMEKNDFKTEAELDHDWDMDIDEELDITWT